MRIRISRYPSCWWQYWLWLIGIAWHNKYRDECTPDFNCCVDIGRKNWRHYPRKKK